MVRRNLTKNVTRVQNYLTSAMSGRLILHTSILILLLAGILMATIILFGRLSTVAKQTSEALGLQFSVFEHDLNIHFDSVAARGIRLSEELTSGLENWLKNEGLSFADLQGNPAVIARIENVLFDILYHALNLTDCSGAYYMLDATANLALPGAQYSKCGTYIKIANINVARPVNPKIALFRGYAEARQGRGELHNMWALEFDSSVFSFYDPVLENANPDLHSCFLFSDSIRLPGTWEDVLLLGVPIMGDNGAVYGVCGFEISQPYFKLFHSQSGAIPRIMGLLARRDNARGLNVETGLKAGNRAGFFLELSGTLFSSPGPGFTIYRSTDSAFVGIEAALRLSPLEQKRRAVVLMPKEDYDRARWKHLRENLAIAALVILSGISGSIFMSRMYVEPILRGLRQAKSDEISGGVNIQEIDDLLDFLFEQDKRRGEKQLKMEQQLATLQKESEREKYILPDREAYEEFLENLTTLTNAEREVFNLYMQGYRAKDMPEILWRSINTIKTHNKRIYVKLGVSSRHELMGYMAMMKQEQKKKQES